MGFSLSGGFAAGAGADELKDLLARAFAEQQARIRARQEQQRIDLDAKRLQNDTDYKGMMLRDREDALASAAKAGAANRANALADDLSVGQDLTPDAVKTLTEGDRSNLVKGATLSSENISGNPLTGSLRMAANPGKGPTFTGTAGQLRLATARDDAQRQLETARQDKLDTIAQSRQDKIDAAAQAQQGREDLARLTAGLRGGNADLQRELLQTKVDAANEKTSEQHKAADLARQNALASIDETSNALDELIDANGQLKPGVSGAFGWDALRSRIPGTGAADAKARLDRLQSRLTVDLLGEMKRQSRTGASGFGQLSEKELLVLQNAAARLGTNQSDESARQALLDVRKQLASMRQRAGGGVGAAPPADAGGSSALDILNARRKGGG